MVLEKPMNGIKGISRLINQILKNLNISLSFLSQIFNSKIFFPNFENINNLNSNND